jgi:hypothetical protein
VSLVGVVTAVTSAIVGAVVSEFKFYSTVKDVIVRELINHEFAVSTVIVQSEYVPSLKEIKVMVVLFPLVADVVPDEQEPPYVIVPASLVENV